MAANIPGYKIARTLGKGGMATVYLAVQEIFEREVALKVMSKALTDDPTFGKRFMREAQIVSKLIHPNIVTVYDVGLSEGAYYLSMEYIDGADLKHMRKELTFFEKINAIKAIASALDVSGAKGYVHRDIKPENIMIERATKRAVLMDFGIARASEADISVTQAGTAIGTPHYMSPEQAKGLDVDPRADLYSLGVVLFYLTAGYVPFDGDSAVAIGIRHITEAVPELPPHLRELQWFMDKAMAKDPDMRFQTGKEFIAALDGLDLDHIAAEDANHVDDSTDFDTPTVVSEAPKHCYGDGDNTGEQEDFTLSFKTEEPPTLNLKWPLYVATGCVAALAAAGIYLVATYEPSSPANLPSVKSPSAQNSVAELVLGKSLNLTPEQQVQFEALQIQTEKALRAYQDYPSASNLKVLVGLYNEQLKLAPNEPTITEAINLLADELAAELLPTFNAGEFKEAQKKLAQIIELFPNYTSTALADARSLMTERGKVEKLLDDGRFYLRRRQYAEPAGQNATQSYQQALQIAPGLKPAQSGLREIADALISKAKKALSDGDIATARKLVGQALEADSLHSDALILEKQLLSSVSIEEQIQTLFAQGERLTRKGQWFHPKGQSAFDSYNAILVLDSRNELAQRRLTGLVDTLKKAIDERISESAYEGANAMVARAQGNYPDFEPLTQLQITVEKAIADHQYTTLPRIATIRASGTPKVALERLQPRTIAVADKLYIGFDFDNFSQGKVMLTSRLYHGDATEALGAKHIFVKGPKGQSEFVIDFGRSGPPAGRYRLELWVAGKLIGELNFRIG